MSTSKQSLENSLKQTFEDYRLSGEEKQSLRNLAATLDEEDVRFLKNRAFDLFRHHLFETGCPQANRALQWLERSIKALDGSAAIQPPKSYFSPGEECRRAILDSCHKAKSSIDICVFTISDNRISEALISAHKRGINVRIITDDDKSNDDGSDIDLLIRQGLDVRMDNSTNHMHHKFAVFDKAILLNGSFNWTRSASERNQENILITHHPKAVREFINCFEGLWEKYGGKQ
ncbi:Phosphatidylserine/phosphatidylglycerophosphate/cardiolipin synthases and related enzymes [Alteromonadaceae bacterium Bs31]|nr:Phosphatidylserine/phosphatidylglycerophosphate/cardiolipin synthases and related enzymes [Alteromonadaceae bacterium Bs31]